MKHVDSTSLIPIVALGALSLLVVLLIHCDPCQLSPPTWLPMVRVIHAYSLSPGL